MTMMRRKIREREKGEVERKMTRNEMKYKDAEKRKEEDKDQ